MKHLILGGVKSGKSRFAESIAKSSDLPVVYIATASREFNDPDMEERIENHRKFRPNNWTLIEETIHLGREINYQSSNTIILIECLTLWLTNLLLSEESVFHAEKQALIDACSASNSNIIFVSNEVGQGVMPTNKLARNFVDEAGRLHQTLAALCDRVTIVTAGIPLALKESNNAHMDI